MIGDGYKGDFLSVKVVVQHFQRFMAFFREASFIHEHHTVDGQFELTVAVLAIDSTIEHCLYLLGSSPAWTLVVMWVEGFENGGVTKVPNFGLLPFQIGNCQIEGECLGGARGTHNDWRSMCDCADNIGKQVLLKCLSFSNAGGELYSIDVPVQLITECLQMLGVKGLYMACKHLQSQCAAT